MPRLKFLVTQPKATASMTLISWVLWMKFPILGYKHLSSLHLWYQLLPRKVIQLCQLPTHEFPEVIVELTGEAGVSFLSIFSLWAALWRPILWSWIFIDSIPVSGFN